MGAYFPDYALRVSPTVDSIRATGGDISAKVIIPAVKLYTDTVLISANITPTPATGTFTITFPNGSVITSYPDSSKKVRVQTSGGVTAGTYTLNIVTNGPNGTPVHTRAVTLYVNNLVTGIITNDVVRKFELYQNYPNPFNPTTNIGYTLTKETNVKLTFYDVAGKQISVMDLGRQSLGTHVVPFNGENLSSGIYFYKLEAGDFKAVKSMILLK
jgi:hypothetical protein